ncbi:copper amine oxidase N-terminal domain-containing protein [Paenibacillus rhizovicinus]|uniref:Copper amine oxidase N-terminal domain-containing protein n=1 Tax=Paenibacillus rhizovicinus TaxID=2704463 RepID=A0A6C0P2U2_9BACL|nr:copper amine oxidase N-terminal domain-containing protein [Paenibacillus rhizovicinus]QHW32844.1 copper amine oxidase N-terminal domain-containing protein [Paenibacillus rhizovicinus]
MNALKFKGIAAAVLAAALVWPSIAAPKVAHAGTTAYVRLAWDNGGESSSNGIIKNGRIYVPADLFEMAGMRLQWDKAHQRADIIGYGKSAAVRIGQSAGVIDGAPTRGDAAPFMYGGQLYVSATFLVMVLEGGSIQWDGAHRLFTAKGLHTFASFSQTYGGRTFSIVNRTGELFVNGGKNGASVKLADLGSPIYGGVSMDFQPTEGGLLYVTIHDNYGEPHLGNHIFTLILKNGVVIRKANASYWYRFMPNVTSYGHHLLMTDGKTLRILADGTADVEQTLDLVKLGGEEDNYFVEGIADDFVLIRPNRSGLLTLVDRKTGGSVQLYKQLLSAEEITLAETNDTIYGDWLQYVKREGSTLYFKNGSSLEKNRDKLYAYTLPVPAADEASVQ